MNKSVQFIHSLIRPHILELKAYTADRDKKENQGEALLLFDANENPFPTVVNRYPDPNQTELKQRVSKLKNISTDQILFGNGSDDLINQIILGFCAPQKDTVIVCPPTFGMYQFWCKLHQVSVTEVPLDNNFQLDLTSIFAEYTSQTKCIFIPSPNNPTGNCFHPSDIIQLIEKFQGLVVLDEAYIEFSNQSLLHKLNDYPNLIILQTFSKAQGLAGIRLGMLFAHPEIVKLLSIIKPPYNISSLTINKALERLSDSSVAIEISTLLNEKERLLAVLKEVKWIKTIYPSDANFFMIKVDDSKKRFHFFMLHKILVRNTSAQLGCENTLRIAIGTPEENARLIDILNEEVN